MRGWGYDSLQSRRGGKGEDGGGKGGACFFLAAPFRAFVLGLTPPQNNTTMPIVFDNEELRKYALHFHDQALEIDKNVPVEDNDARKARADFAEKRTPSIGQLLLLGLKFADSAVDSSTAFVSHSSFLNDVRVAVDSHIGKPMNVLVDEGLVAVNVVNKDFTRFVKESKRIKDYFEKNGTVEDLQIFRLYVNKSGRRMKVLRVDNIVQYIAIAITIVMQATSEGRNDALNQSVYIRPLTRVEVVKKLGWPEEDNSNDGRSKNDRAKRKRAKKKSAPDETGPKRKRQRSLTPSARISGSSSTPPTQPRSSSPQPMEFSPSMTMASSMSSTPSPSPLESSLSPDLDVLFSNEVPGSTDDLSVDDLSAVDTFLSSDDVAGMFDAESDTIHHSPPSHERPT